MWYYPQPINTLEKILDRENQWPWPQYEPYRPYEPIDYDKLAERMAQITKPSTTDNQTHVPCKHCGK